MLAPPRFEISYPRPYRMATTGTNSSRIGVDVGGTFTDVILQSADGTRHDPQGALDAAGLRRGRRRGGRRARRPTRATVDGVVHGTTVATNAVLERRGAVTALVTTAGFRDVLELRRLRIPHMYDPFWRKPEPLVPRRRALRGDRARRPPTARCSARSTRTRCAPLAGAAARRPASSRSRSACCTRTASRRTRSASARSCARSCPASTVSLSSEILREQREYERSATTVVNAYVRPLMGRLRRRASAAGSTAPASTRRSRSCSRPAA